MNNEEKNELSELIVKAFEGQITDQQRQSLNKIIANDRDAAVWYLEFMDMLSCFSKYGTTDIADISNDSTEANADNTLSGDFEDNIVLWRSLAEEEINAPTVTIEKPIQTKPIEKIEVAKLQRQVSKLAIYTLAVSTAAIFLMLVMILLTPSTLPVIAVLDEQIGTEWGAMAQPLEDGSELRAGLLSLNKGFVSIKFSKGAEVVIEGPADFELLTDEQMMLLSGKLSAKVPGRAKGFIVQTPTATVVDYGTEFGVEVNETANTTETHVFAGLVELRDSSDPARFSASERLKAGMAASVRNGRISKVYRSVPEQFITELPSEYEMLIRESRPDAYWLLAKSLTNSVGSKKYRGQTQGNVRSINLFSTDRQQKQMQAIAMNPYDGDDEEISFGDVLDPGRDSYSLSIWFKPLSLEENRRQFIASKRDERIGWSILAIGNDIMLRTGTQATSSKIWIGRKDSLTLDWHHVVLVIDRETNMLKGYIDGSSNGWEVQRKEDYAEFLINRTEDTYRSNTVINNTHPMIVGSNVKGSINSSDVSIVSSRDGTKRRSVAFHGLVYDVAVWKRALNESEIRQLYDKCPLSDGR